MTDELIRSSNVRRGGVVREAISQRRGRVWEQAPAPGTWWIVWDDKPERPTAHHYRELRSVR